MNSAYEYPELASRETPDAWVEAGRPLLRDKARARAKEILAQAVPTIVQDVENTIAETLPIVRVHGA